MFSTFFPEGDFFAASLMIDIFPVSIICASMLAGLVALIGCVAYEGVFLRVQLSRAVQSWEPVQERVPLHAWLHPWLEMLGPQLEDLYPPIRFKLATALQAWHPSDASALALLSPWHKARK